MNRFFLGLLRGVTTISFIILGYLLYSFVVVLNMI